MKTTAAPQALIEADGLTVRFRTRSGLVHAVSDVSFEIAPGETVAIVGESGSGKSTTGLAMLGLLSTSGEMSIAGAVRLRTKSGGVTDILRCSTRDQRRIRGNDVAMIFQDPMSSLNPIFSIGTQVAEAVQQHRTMGSTHALEEAEKLLQELGIANPDRILASYPHQLSGGMRQRVMIAIALSCRPSVLIADEPTTALDVTIQAQILALLKRLQHDTGMAIVFITHNLGVVAEIADRMLVMYAGRIVESGPVSALFKSPRMPYTRSLLQSVPRLDNLAAEPLKAIPGNVPSAMALPSGCSFHPRCEYRLNGLCDAILPALDQAGADHLVRCARWREIT